jgi:hypothetical protein
MGLGEVIFFGIGTNPKGCFLGGMGGEVWLFFKVGRWDLKKIPRNYSFGGVGWGLWRKWMCMGFFLVFFFCDIMI